MFQADPILWLQSIESPFMNTAMTFISSMGYSIVYGVLITILIFMVDKRKGLYIFLILSINGILTDGLKRGLQFPRPSDIDIRINEPGMKATYKLVESGAAQSFWSLPTDQAMEATRTQTSWSYGLPSGHVSAAAAFFFGLAFFFRRRAVFIFSTIWVILMALSRMYLGRHFLADVIGGVISGGLAIAIALILLHPFLKSDSPKYDPKHYLPLLGFTIPLVILYPFIELLDSENIGRLLACIVTYFFIDIIDLWSYGKKLWQRLVLVVLSLPCYFIAKTLIEAFMESMNLEETRTSMFLVTLLLTSIPFVGAFALFKKLKMN